MRANEAPTGPWQLNHVVEYASRPAHINYFRLPQPLLVNYRAVWVPIFVSNKLRAYFQKWAWPR